MTQQKAGYPSQGYGQTATEGANDHLRDMADATGKRAKETADSAQEVAGNIADQARHHGERAQEAVKPFRPSSRSRSKSSRSRRLRSRPPSA